MGPDDRWDPGDLHRLRELYEPLRRFAAVVGRYDLDPDDLVQEAFTRVLVARPLRDYRDLGAYLRRTIVNLAKNERRSRSRGSAAHARLVAWTNDDPPPPSDLSDLLRLDPVGRGLLYLVEVEGSSIREAAAMVGCTEPAARMRLSRARRQLRAALESERRVTEVRDLLDELAHRGEPRGADRVVAAGVADAARRVAVSPRAPARRRGTALVAAATVIMLAVVVGVLALRADDEPSRARVGTKPTSGSPIPPSTTLPPPSASIPAGLLGRVAWVDGKELVTASASQPRPRVIAKGPVTNPKWSPNGRWLAYTRSDGLHVVSAAGKQVQLILTKADYEWSPQGDSIAWTDGKLRVTDVTTGIESTIAAKNTVTGYAWSPDGRELAVASLDPGDPTLGFDVVDVSSGARRTVPFAPAEYQASRFNPLFIAGWEPDGKAVLVWVDLMGSGSIAQDGLDLWLVPLDGSAPHNLGQTLVKREWIRWSPDGTRLATVRSNWRGVNDGNRTVTVCTTAGACTELSGSDSATMDPSWSPDGRELIFVQKPAKQAMPEVHGNRVEWRSLYAARRLWIANADGSDAREVAGAGSGVASPRWAADGERVLFVRDDTLWALNLANARAVRVVAPIAPVPVFEFRYQSNPAPPDVPYEAGSANGYPTWESLVSWSR